MTFPSVVTSACMTDISPPLPTSAVTKVGSVGLYASGSVVRLEFEASSCVALRKSLM